jgi:predicted ABC-type transport system involved in lysophospholipase L1 biosynthesis ATPase subunit
MDPVDLDARLDAQAEALKRTEAETRAAAAMLTEATARQRFAESQAQRYTKLFAENVGSAEVVETWRKDAQAAAAGQLNAQARLEASRHEMARLEADREGLLQQRDNLRLPAQLSGGEQQRVAIARALVNRPPVILADEPTAPLDSERALTVMRILNQMAAQYETAIIVVTHDEKIIPIFKRIYHIRDGRTHEEAGEGRAWQ